MLPAVAQVAMVNRWMTGSIFSSPYNFGDAEFRSVDWFDPEFAAVLFHPYHDLFVYHPFYLLGMLALAAEIYAARRRRCWILAATLIAIAAKVWLQASWYAWWLGTATFGMRGMAPAALPLTIAFIAWVQRRHRPVVLAFAALCAVWSALLLRRGLVTMYTWRDVLETQASGLGTILEPRIMVAAVVAGVAVVAWSRAERARRHRVAHDGGTSTPVVATTAVVVAIAGGWLLSLFPHVPLSSEQGELLWSASLWSALGAAAWRVLFVMDLAVHILPARSVAAALCATQPP